MTRFVTVQQELAGEPKVWLVTGAAGFIGSNLTEQLLRLGQTVVGIDNFATGKRENLEDVRARLSGDEWARFRLVEGDIVDPEVSAAGMVGVDYVLHQAALGSVPRSVKDPIATNLANVEGFLRVLVAAREAGVARVVYAGSSSTYGDHPGLPKVEETIGRPLSPYAVSKYADELYASVFESTYDMSVVGLRYFNVFGRRQDPEGAYAAVIPKWVGQLLRGEPCVIHGDGETSRDFCYIDNVVQANLLAARQEEHGGIGPIYNVAVGGRTTLNELFGLLRDGLAGRFPHLAGTEPVYSEFRAGDVRHSQADITKARTVLGYEPTHDLRHGLEETLDWYVERFGGGASLEAAGEYARPTVA